MRISSMISAETGLVIQSDCLPIVVFYPQAHLGDFIAVGFKHKRKEDLTVGGGLSYVWEGNLPIEDSGGVSGKYKDVSIIIASVYARWN